jgi:iron complex outermembrane receptor protein
LKGGRLLLPDSDWSVVQLQRLKSQVKSDGSWQKWDVTLASPSKATAWVGWAPDPWSLRVQSQQVFDLSDASGNGSTAIIPSTLSAAISCRWVN